MQDPESDEAQLETDDVIPTLGWDFPLFGMRKVLRCQNCKARGLANVHEATLLGAKYLP